MGSTSELMSDSSSDKEDKWLLNQMSVFESDPFDPDGPPPLFNIPPPPLPLVLRQSDCDSPHQATKPPFDLQSHLDTCDSNLVSMTRLQFTIGTKYGALYTGSSLILNSLAKRIHNLVAQLH